MRKDPREAFLRSRGAAQTRRAYRLDLKRFAQFLAGREGGPRRVADATPEVVRDYVDALRDRSLSVATKRRRVSALRQFFDWLRAEGLRASNPVQVTAPFEAGPDSPAADRTLDRSDLRTLLDAFDRDSVRGQRDYTLILLVVYGALRRGEVASLDVDDVRPLGRHWVVDLPVTSRGSGGYVRLPDAVAEQVQRLAGRYEDDEGPLWRSLSNRNRGARLTPDGLYKIVRRAGEEVGLDALSIDLLRRSGLRLAAAGGASVGALRRHARLQTTASTARYAEVEADGGSLSSAVSDRIPLDLDADR
jgi:site-specific recombinase XerD